MQIQFDTDAYETFQNVVDALAGYTVDIYVAEEDRALDGVMLLGADREAQDGDTVKYRFVHKHFGSAIGPIQSVRAESVRVL